MSEEKKEPTQEELKEYREKMLKYYAEELPLLKKRKEYEVLLADVEEARARRIGRTIQIGQMLAPPPPDEIEEEKEISSSTEGKDKKRSLKTT